MAISDIEKTYESSIYPIGNLTGAAADVADVDIVRDLTIKGLTVIVGEAVSGDAVFALYKNGSEETSAALTIASGTRTGSVSGLSIAVVTGDKIVLRRSLGTITQAVTIALSVDYGIPIALADLPEIDRLQVLGRANPGTGEVEAVYFSADFTISDDGKIANQSLVLESLTEKTTPVGNDLLLIADSEDGNNKKSVKVSNLPGGGDGGSSSDGYSQVTWTNKVNCIRELDNSIYKNAGGTGFNAGASSVEKITGDGAMKWIIGDKYCAVGLSLVDASQSYDTILYGFTNGDVNGQLSYIENGGVDVIANSWAVGYVCEVKRVGTVITFYVNDVLVKTSSISSSGDLFVDTAIAFQGDSISRVYIKNG